MKTNLRSAQLAELARHLQNAREDERARLARDLHDELGALLTSAQLDIARIRARLAGAAPEAQERLDHVGATLDSVIALKRRIVEDLRPSSLDHLGLVVTPEILAREFGDRADVAVHLAIASVDLASAAQLVVFRLVQEAVNNVGRHARATQVWISLRPCAGHAELAMRDDGVGFDSRARPQSTHRLLGMRHRVETENGTMVVDSGPDRGTTLTIRLPLAVPATA